MPRPERPLDPAAGPIQAFAADLRKLRQEAGNPKYLQMQRLTGRSRTSLAEAAGGDHLATWETVEAYVRACGGDLADWEARWAHVRDTLRSPRSETLAQGPSPAIPPAQPHRPRTWIWAVVAVVAGVAATAAVYGLRSPAAARPKAGATGPAVIVVQNKVAIGPSALTEDTTPIYLSSRPIPVCSRHGCEIPRTQMWSGAVLQALCQSRAAEMTNEDLVSPGITHNKGGITSSLWYQAEMPNGIAGYISEVYIAPAYRGGLGLPACSP